MLTRRSPHESNSTIVNTMASEEVAERRDGGHARKLWRETSYLTDDGEVLARELPRQKLLARMGLNRKSSELVNNDANKGFIGEICGGLYRRSPDKALFVLRDRRAGTMTEMREGRVLPRRFEDVRRRQEHVERGMVEMGDIGSGGRGGLGIVKEAFIQEFRDLYEIIGSMECRKWDLCKGDVCGLFEWFKMVDNFLRVYVMVSQKWYVIGGFGEWGMVEKKKVIKAAERVEEMKRVMIGMDERCREMIGRLRRRVEELVDSVLTFLEEEDSTVGKIMENGWDALVRRMCVDDCGKEVVILLGRGTRDVEWGRKMGGWRAFRRVKERHWDYVAMFVAAKREYRTMYGRLGEEMDRRGK